MKTVIYLFHYLYFNFFKYDYVNVSLKGIVSRDFEWLQMILMNRFWVPDVPLVVYYFLNLHFHIVF